MTGKETEQDLSVTQEQDISQEEISFKTIILGDPGVGKSCLSLKAIKNVFEDCYNSTVGFEFLTYYTKIDNINIKLQIWDTCGQEAYKSLIKSFYRNSALAIVVYSIDSNESFKHLDEWINDIKRESNPDVKIVLIGNKADKEQEREVQKEMGEKFSKDNKVNFFMETSAKTGFNVNKLFDDAARLLYEESKKLKEKAVQNNAIPISNTSEFSDTESEKGKGKCNCKKCC